MSLGSESVALMKHPAQEAIGTGPKTCGRSVPNWWHGCEPCVGDLAAFVERPTHKADYPYCDEVVQGIPVYCGATLLAHLERQELRCDLEHELARALSEGPGVVLVRQAWSDLSVLDRVTENFRKLIDEEARLPVGAGVHFGRAGNDSRIRNSLQRLCEIDPEAYVRYYGNEILDLLAQAWLGPGYRVTSRVDMVHPGEQAQTPRLGHYLGFMTVERLERFPTHVHRISPYLSLQAMVAHVDMPLQSGTTMFLPNSQRYEQGFRATSRPEFRTYFEERSVQLPLGRGDAVFFNPAVIHAAGSNSSSHLSRLANLMLISSPLGVATESVDSQRICSAIYPQLLTLVERNELSAGELEALVSVSADGCALASHLDPNPPVVGLSFPTQQDLLRYAIAERWPEGLFAEQLTALIA